MNDWENDYVKCPKCHCTNRMKGEYDFIIDDSRIGVFIVGYVCQWPECWGKLIDYRHSNLSPLVYQLGEDEDLSEPGLIKEIRFYLFLRMYWMGEIVRFPHSGKSMIHSFDIEAHDLDGNNYFLEIVSTYRDQGGFRLQTYNKDRRERLEIAKECGNGGDVYPFIIFELPYKGGQEWYGLPVTSRSKFLDYTSDLRLSKKLKRKILRLSKMKEIEIHQSVVSMYQGKTTITRS